jgi:hypothetical protein
MGGEVIKGFVFMINYLSGSPLSKTTIIFLEMLQ